MHWWLWGATAGFGFAQPASDDWHVPRTLDGHPDLQGVWVNNSVTPMTRPTQWKDKTELAEQELAELQNSVHSNSIRARMPYLPINSFRGLSSCIRQANTIKSRRILGPATTTTSGLPSVTGTLEHRSSPTRPTASFPPLTAEGQARRKAGSQRRLVTAEGGPAGRADGAGGSLAVGALYYSRRALHPSCIQQLLQIVQSASSVVILQETIHDARLVPSAMRRRPACRPACACGQATPEADGTGIRSSWRRRTSARAFRGPRRM